MGSGNVGKKNHNSEKDDEKPMHMYYCFLRTKSTTVNIVDQNDIDNYIENNGRNILS
jgi:hypothetical protein